MRELKFRAWDNLKKEFLSQKRMLPSVSKNENTFFFLQHELGFIIQQFTSFKDNKGKDIYEGDIVQIEGGYIGEICCDRGCFFIKSPELEKILQDIIYLYAFEEMSNGGLVVIGNIFENKELLNRLD